MSAHARSREPGEDDDQIADVAELDAADAAPLKAAKDPIFAELGAAFHTVNLDDLTTDPPPIEYISKPRLPEGKVCVLSGTGGLGKSAYAIQLAIRRAMGMTDLDGSELKAGETVFLTGEDGKVDYDRKIAAHRDVVPGFDPEKIADKISVWDCTGIPGVEWVRGDHGSYAVTWMPDAIADVLQERAPNADLLVVETISRFGAGETGEALARMVSAGERICKLRLQAGRMIVVLLVTHASQAAARAGETDQFGTRGATTLTDNARSVITMAKLTDDTLSALAPGAVLSEEEMRRYVVLRHPKSLGPEARTVILERGGNEWGAYLQVADIRDSKHNSDSARMFRLRKLVSELNQGGVAVTFTKLRKRYSEFGLSENRMESFLDNAIRDGELEEDQTRKVQGGGHPLILGKPRYSESGAVCGAEPGQTELTRPTSGVRA